MTRLKYKDVLLAVVDSRSVCGGFARRPQTGRVPAANT